MIQSIVNGDGLCLNHYNVHVVHLQQRTDASKLESHELPQSVRVDLGMKSLSTAAR